MIPYSPPPCAHKLKVEKTAETEFTVNSKLLRDRVKNCPIRNRT